MIKTTLTLLAGLVFLIVLVNKSQENLTESLKFKEQN